MKKFLLFSLFAVFTLLIAGNSYAQITIGANPYTNLKAAFDAINAGTETGAITININSSFSEPDSAVLNASGVGGASYTSVLIKPTAPGLNITGNLSGKGIIILNGADNVTIDGRVGAGTTRELTIINNALTTTTAVIQNRSLGVGLGATNNTVTYCILQAGNNIPTLSVYGIYAGGVTITTTGTGADNDNLTFTNNKFQKMTHGIYVRGTSTANPNFNINISNNIIGDDDTSRYVTVNGLDMTNDSAVTINNNKIYNLIRTHTAALRAMNLSAGIIDATINANEIGNIRNTTTSSFISGQGIFIANATPNLNRTQISNNTIYNISGGLGSGTATNNQWGIIISTGNNYDIWYNSISMTNNSVATGSTDRHGGILLNSSTSSGLNIQNNNISVTMAPGNATLGNVFCINSVVTNPANFTAIDYNNYYGTGARFGVGFLTSVRTTLADWQTATTQDGHSISGNPLFASSTSLLAVSTTSPCLGAGISLSLATDILGNARGGSPTIGAYELPVDLADAGVTIVYTLGKLAAGYNDGSVITAIVANTGNTTLTSLNVTLNITGANTFSNMKTIPTLGIGASTLVTFDPFTPTALGTNTVTVSVPSDGNNGNNSFSINNQEVTPNSSSYALGTVAAGGVGFNGATGDFVAKFNLAITTVLNQVNVNFSTGGQTFRIGVWDDDGIGGTPGTLLYESGDQLSTSGVFTVLVSPGLNLSPGDFYVGVRQIGTVNVSFSYQSETPIRAQTFYFASPTGSTTWNDFSPANSFRFMIEPRYALNNDVGAGNINQSGTTYLPIGTTNIPMTGNANNYGQNTNTFDVVRKIYDNLGSLIYNQTTTVTGLVGSSSTPTTFPDFTGFTEGVTYTIVDSSTLATDQNIDNNRSQTTYTPIVARTMAVVWNDAASRDSLVAQLNARGYTNDYNLVAGAGFTGTFRNWRSVFYLCTSTGNWTTAHRDSMRAWLDASTPGPNKKTLFIFGNDLGYNNDPIRNVSAPALDTVFYRQYLRGQYIADNWLTSVLPANRLFYGTGLLSTITADSVQDPFPDLVLPARWNDGGNIAALFLPQTTTTGDSAVGIAYGSMTTNYNLFYGTNVYANYRTRIGGTLDNPIDVFDALANWANANEGALPVELISFTATANKNNVDLKWTTATETNNSGFEIERRLSSDSEWRRIASVEGYGNSNEPKQYSFSDRNLQTGKYNYRLKQIDFNGNFEYHNLTGEIIVGVPEKFDLSQNYPNPFNPITKINYGLSVEGKVTLKVFDITGREVAKLVNEVKTAGYYTIQFNANAFASGVYFYQIYANGINGKDFLMTKKMMLIK